MKAIKLLKLLLISALIPTVNIYADIFIIEDEQDLRGVSNTFIDFYCNNWENLLIFQQKEFKKCDEFSAVILKLRTSESPLYTSYLKDKKTFRSNFLKLKHYIKQNVSEIKKQLGEKNYNFFLNGVFYTQQLLKNLR